MAGVGVWWRSYSFDFPVEDFAFRLWRDVKPSGRWLKLHRSTKTSFKLADWPIHNHDCRAVIHPNDSSKFAVVTDDITGPEPVGMGFTGQPDDAKKFRLVFVVGDSLGVAHNIIGRNSHWPGDLKNLAGRLPHDPRLRFSKAGRRGSGRGSL